MSTAAAPAPAPAPAPRMNFRTRIRNTGTRFKNWTARHWALVRPGPETRKGAVWAAIVTSGLAALIAGTVVHFGFGTVLDTLICLVIVGILFPLVAWLIQFVLWALRKLPGFATGAVVVSALFFVLLIPPPAGLALGLGIALLEAVLGAAIATLLPGRFGEAALSKKIVTFALLG